MQYAPDRTIAAALKRIDRGLSIAWVEPQCRWAVFHDLQVEGNPEEEVDRLATALQLDAAKMGYVVSRWDCVETARNALVARKLVCYVVDDDGTYRSLDSRIVKKLERMDYYRRNCGLRDWRQMLDARADALRRARSIAQGDVWDCIQHDRVFASQVSDILWGVRPVRSVTVPEGVPDANDRERHPEARPGESPGQEAERDRGDGSGVAATDAGAGAVPGHSAYR